MSLSRLRQTSVWTQNSARVSFTLFILSLLFGLSACDDSAAPIREREILVEVPGGDPSIFNGNTQPREARILVAAGEANKSLPLNGEIELGVILFNGQGEPVSGERVQYALVNADDSGVALSASMTTTDVNGYARVSFYAGERVNAYDVEVSHRQSLAPITFNLDVLDLPNGGLNITFDYQGPVTLDQLEVYIVEQASICDNVYYFSLSCSSQSSRFFY